MSDHTERTRRLLEEIAAGKTLTQRGLARRIGMALGLTNQLLRDLSAQGLLLSRPTSSNRATYVLTEAGLEMNAHLSREHLRGNLSSYAAARDQIRQRLAQIADRHTSTTSGPPRVIFYGTGQAAEIGISCVADVGLCLVGVVDDTSGENEAILGLPIQSHVALTATSLGGEPFDCVVVTSLTGTDDIQRQLQILGLANERVFWL